MGFVTDMVANALEMRGITKRFGRLVANNAIDFTVARGEIHCLLGENGAGKTTLMKVLFGLHKKDAGEILFEGRRVEIAGPRDAIARGIGMVHQHFMLVGRLTVAENIVAGMEPHRGLLLDYQSARETVRSISERYGLKVDPDARVEEISVGQQQRVEILKALLREAELLIFDEPTAVLTPQEAQELFEVMRRLKASGKTIIFITHKLKETMEISDRVTILRDGRKVGTVETARTDPGQLAEMMVGRRVELQVTRPQAVPGTLPGAGPEGAGGATGETGAEAAAARTVLALQDLWARGPGGRYRLKGINLEVRRGEILGIAGVEGNGQLELEEVIAGLLKPARGRVLLGAEEITALNPRAIRERGVAYIPSDRLKRGLIGNFSVAQNLILGSQRATGFAARGILNHRQIAAEARRIMADFDIRAASLHEPVSSLSGGNQQKVVIARELSRRPALVVAAQPTRGVDVGAIEYIHRQLLRMRAEGKGILLISAELDELRSLSDRIAVLYEGQIVAEGPAGGFTERELGLLMAGGRRA